MSSNKKPLLRTAGGRKPSMSAEALRHRRAEDPADVAATVLLRRAISAAALSVADLRVPGIVVGVTVPAGEWVDPACRAWMSLVSGDGSASADEDVSSFVDRPEVHFLKRSREPDKREVAHGEEAFANAVWRGQGTVGFTCDLAWLPRDFEETADLCLRMGCLSAVDATELARRLTGRKPALRLTDEEAGAVGPRLLRLAGRASQTGIDYVSRLRRLARAAIAARRACPVSKVNGRSGALRNAAVLDDLHGMEEAVTWGRAVCEDIQAYRAGHRTWEEMDRGALVSGPPGCGKTLFAAAVARTCGVPLIEGSWSRWLANGTGHQGDFMLAMKGTFAEAREQAPCILFIDEIDSFPNRRELTHSQKDWDIQVVNGLLAELDGTQGRPGVVVIGACNNPELLDPALVRSGRIERHIRMSMPDVKALAAIMREHLGKDIEDESLEGAALRAIGASGADVERMVRGARRRARLEVRRLTLHDLLEEIGGADRRSADELARAAVHEAGHAVVGLELGLTIQAATIRCFNGEGGVFGNARWRSFPTAHDIHDEIVCALAGRAAEQAIVGDPCSGSGGGPESDLAKATELAARAVSEFGFDEENGLVWAPVAQADRQRRPLDPKLAERVRERLADAYADACAIVSRRRSAVCALASELLVNVALDGDEVARIVGASLSEEVA